VGVSQRQAICLKFVQNTDNEITTALGESGLNHRAGKGSS
jgi:hypothetical protein